MEVMFIILALTCIAAMGALLMCFIDRYRVEGEVSDCSKEPSISSKKIISRCEICGRAYYQCPCALCNNDPKCPECKLEFEEEGGIE